MGEDTDGGDGEDGEVTGQSSVSKESRRESQLTKIQAMLDTTKVRCVERLHVYIALQYLLGVSPSL